MIRWHRMGIEVDRYSASSDREALDRYQGTYVEPDLEADAYLAEMRAQRIEDDKLESR